MDDNTSIQFRLRLAQINGIKINEAKDHVSTEIDYVGGAHDRAEDAKTHGVKITPLRKKVQDSDHSVSGSREKVRKFLVRHYDGDKTEAHENHPEVFKGMNEEKIDDENKPDVRLPMAPADQYGKNRITPTKTYNPNTGETKPIQEAGKKRDPEIDHMRNIVNAYFVARAKDKDPEDVRGAHQRAAEAAAAKHPTDHMGQSTHAAHVENAVRRHLEYVSGRIPNPSASGSDGNQVRQGLSGNQYTGHPDNTKGVNVSNQVRQGLRGNQN